MCGESGCIFHSSVRELGTGGCFLGVITVLMGREISMWADAWRSLVLFQLGVNQNLHTPEQEEKLRDEREMINGSCLQVLY